MSLKIGVDIGSKYIKIVEGYEKKDSLYLTNIEKIENPIENFRNISIEDTEILGNFLRDFLNKNNYKGKKCIFSIAGNNIIFHYFELPNLSEEELENAIKLEGIQIIPDFLDNYEYDYISFNIDSKKNIFLISCPLIKVEIYNKIFLKAKLRPLIMDVDGLAVLNSFLYFNKDTNSVCILNIGFSISNLVIFLKDKFLFCRDILWGTHNIEKIEEFEKNVILNDIIPEFIEDINVSLKYFQNKTGEKINKMYLTGGGANISGIKEVIEKNINIPCENYNPLSFFSESLIPLDKIENGMSYAVCIGLLTRKII
ncbi:MAG TPA: pilus assembly protein PilM [bacterium]|nr:pilus assembly protein PilM [bacterium]HOM27679.1 pilus assembly protein PilM [bacterium]